MSRYAFYTAHLRFLADRTERINAEVAEMMDILQAVAAQIEAEPSETPAGGDKVVTAGFTLKAAQLRLGARALAGVAGFLQKQILPEVVANQNTVGERDVRWVIDTSMALTSKILMHAEITKDAEDLTLSLPAPPTLH